MELVRANAEAAEEEAEDLARIEEDSENEASSAEEIALASAIELVGAGEIRVVPLNERIQMQRIRELDLEQLEEEEVGSDGENVHSDDSSLEIHGDRGARVRGGFTFDTCLTSLHSYLGEVDDIHFSRSFLDGGAVLTLPMFYLEGIVLFPEDTLPLRVLQPRFMAAVERAVRQSEAPFTLGVVHIHDRGRLRGSGVMASVGTTAEIRQLRRLDDGSMNVATRGRQRFRILKAWIEADGCPCAQVQIIEEDKPMHIPRDAFGLLASVPSQQSGRVARVSPHTYSLSGEDTIQQADSEASSMEDDDSDSGQAAVVFENEDLQVGWRQRRRGRRWKVGSRNGEGEPSSGAAAGQSGTAIPANKKQKLCWEWGGACKAWAADESKWIGRAQRSAWPHWVYRMYDAYNLARRAADMLRKTADLPRIDDMMHNPALFSFYIASNLPFQDSTRQELLEVDGVVHRLRKEIQLLESMDKVYCKICSAVIARRSDMLVMSTDGPISTFVNAYGYVQKTLTVSQAWGLTLQGLPEIANSWFPGYAWTIADCRSCELHMGWLFTAVKKDLLPRSFWGIRSSQIANKHGQ